MGIKILILIVGLIIIFLSFIVSDKVSKGTGDGEYPVVDDQFVRRILKENEEQIKEISKSIIDEKIEEEVNKADDQLGHISNEKIMAVSEFSDQILEKIEQNHKEVVFLYDMLNAKENEMKEFVQEIDKSKVVLEELANKELEKQKMLQHKRIQKELEKQMKKQEELEREKEELMLSGVLPQEKKEEFVLEKEVVEKEEVQEEMPQKVNTQMAALEQIENVEEEASVVKEKETVLTKKKEIALDDANQNQVILDLYNEGKSIMEIAKLLGKGQGEVKLVIDLFQGARR